MNMGLQCRNITKQYPRPPSQEENPRLEKPSPPVPRRGRAVESKEPTRWRAARALPNKHRTGSLGQTCKCLVTMPGDAGGASQTCPVVYGLERAFGKSRFPKREAGAQQPQERVGAGQRRPLGPPPNPAGDSICVSALWPAGLPTLPPGLCSQGASASTDGVDRTRQYAQEPDSQPGVGPVLLSH